MISLGTLAILVSASLLINIGCYVLVSRRDGSYLNILTPSALVTIPALYVLPLIYAYLFQTDGTTYAYGYIYATFAVQNVAFAYFYCRKGAGTVRLPFRFGRANFWAASLVCVGLAALVYLPVLLQFPQYILNPRQIYIETRVGFGASSFTSATLAYVGIVFALFSRRSPIMKGLLITASTIVLSLHGSKGQVLEVLFFVLLYLVYAKGKRFNFVTALMGAAGVSLVVVALFAGSMALGESPIEALEAISEYSDYTRHDLLVIDSKFPVQFGRLTLESNTISLLPRALFPNKPKNFGTFYLAEEFFPRQFDSETGAPAFAIGVEYADFGWLAIVYLSLFSAAKGWLARIAVDRVRITRHPGDLILVAFFAEVTIFPVGIGWFLPETLAVVLLMRWVSCIGANTVCRERIAARPSEGLPPMSATAEVY